MMSDAFMLQLQDYARPANDTGIGVHWSSGSTEPKHIRKYLPVLEEMSVTWVKALGKGHDYDREACRLLIDAGIMPVVRLYQRRPHPHFVPTVEYVKKYVDVGVKYVEFGNEPNLDPGAGPEWDQSWYQGSQPNRVGEQCLKAIENCKKAGAIPMLPAMSPGGSINHEEFFANMLAHMQAVGGDLKPILEGCAIASHPRPLNHPLDYVKDTTAWLVYKWYNEHLKDTYGIVIPQIATEHGCEPGNRDDSTFPRITRLTHKDHNMELVRQVNTGEVDDSFFAGCFWLFAGEKLGNSTFQPAAWLDSSYRDETGRGALPVVQALKEYKAVVRPFRWESTPVQPTHELTEYDRWIAAKKEAGDGSPSTGPEGKRNFGAHIAHFGRTIDEVYDLGFPRFGGRSDYA